MTQFLRSRYIVTLLGMLMIASSTTMPFAYAAPITTSDENAAQGMQVSPAVENITVNPAQTYDMKLAVTNVTGTQLSYTSSVENFTSQGETGTPLIEAKNTLPPTASIISWIAPIPSFTLAPKQTQTLDALVHVPSNAEPGGHYGVIRFTATSTSTGGTGVGISESAGILVLIRVNGAVKEQANIASFTTQNASGQQTSFFQSDTAPITFVTRVQNTGNVFLEPMGNIQIHDMFGGLTATLPVNQAQNGNVLNGSIRAFQSTVSHKVLFGRYTADLTMGYGTHGQAITAETVFWVIPVLPLLVGLVLLILVIYIIRRLIRRYNRYIISQAGHAQAHPPKTKQ